MMPNASACFGITRFQSQPLHPLYLSANAPLVKLDDALKIHRTQNRSPSTPR